MTATLVHPAPMAVAELLDMAHGFARSANEWPGLADPEVRCWRTIASTERFEAFVIAWPAGGAIELHDHGDSAGAVVVAAGDLVESALRPGGDDSPLVVTTRALTSGSSFTFLPGHVHDLVNPGPGPALSVHVYSPVLSAMTFYDLDDVTTLREVRTECFTSTPLHP